MEKLWKKIFIIIIIIILIIIILIIITLIIALFTIHLKPVKAFTVCSVK